MVCGERAWTLTYSVESTFTRSPGSSPTAAVVRATSIISPGDSPNGVGLTASASVWPSRRSPKPVVMPAPVKVVEDSKLATSTIVEKSRVASTGRVGGLIPQVWSGLKVPSSLSICARVAKYFEGFPETPVAKSSLDQR